VSVPCVERSWTAGRGQTVPDRLLWVSLYVGGANALPRWRQGSSIHASVAATGHHTVLSLADASAGAN